ncbi:THAP domain-containing protein 1-like [Aphis craccivora]|uniref:THAP domain-containing protein 1-like n=1 Tax=Aphis craccivora TaxID=307492 RepID=A0A6G0W2W2_APHCR|nr:THAP domain-containing protein 1-like [Aphis craccivora]
MHKFPSNEQTAMKWTNIIKKIQPSYMSLKSLMICSAHFKTSDYNLNYKKIKLNDNVVLTSRKSLMKIFEDLPKNCDIDIFKYLQNYGHKIIVTTKVNETISNTSEYSEASTSLKYNLSNSDTSSVLGVADNLLTSLLVTRIFKTFLSRKRKTFVGDFNENDLNTPRKRKKYWNTSQRTFNEYKRRIKSLENRNQYLKNKIKNVEQLISHLQKTNKISDECYSMLKDSLPDIQKEIILKQLNMTTQRSVTPELRSFALTLNFYSSSAYNYVRKKFNKCLSLGLPPLRVSPG